MTLPPRLHSCRRLAALAAVLAAVLPASNAMAAPPTTMTIVNRTEGVLRGVYLSPKRDDNWGPDRLTGATVQVGESRPVKVPTPACAYDIRVLHEARPKEELLTADICASPTVIVSGKGKLLERSGNKLCDADACGPSAHRGGRFMVFYQPIFCRQAPCPPGSFIVSENGKTRAHAHHLGLASLTAAQQKLFSAPDTSVDGVGVEGSYTLDAKTDTLTITARTVRDGQWKP